MNLGPETQNFGLGPAPTVVIRIKVVSNTNKKYCNSNTIYYLQYCMKKTKYSNWDVFYSAF